MIRMKPDSFRNSTAGLRKSKPAFNLFKSPPQAVLGGYGLFLDVFTSRLRLFVCGRTLLVYRHRLATPLSKTPLRLLTTAAYRRWQRASRLLQTLPPSQGKDRCPVVGSPAPLSRRRR